MKMKMKTRCNEKFSFTFLLGEFQGRRRKFFVSNQHVKGEIKELLGGKKYQRNLLSANDNNNVDNSLNGIIKSYAMMINKIY